MLPICVNHSEWDCTLVGDSTESNTVRLGFRYVHALDEVQAKAMLQARHEKNFRSFQDFIVRTDFSFRSLRALAMASAFESFGLGSREALFQVLASHEGLFRQEEVQQNLFQPTPLAPMSLQEKVMQDYDGTGLSVRAHPTVFLRQQVRTNAAFQKRKADLQWVEVHSEWIKKNTRNRQMIKVMGLSVVLQRPPTAKGTAFCTLEDEHGVLDLIFHREIFQKYKEVLREESFLWVSGEVQREAEAVQIVVKRVEKIFDESFEIPIAPGSHAKIR